jgi:hypothetical protein
VLQSESALLIRILTSHDFAGKGCQDFRLINYFLSLFDRVIFKHIYRQGNLVADALAKKVSSQQLSFIFADLSSLLCLFNFYVL